MICKNPRKTLDKCGKIGYTDLVTETRAVFVYTENTNSKGAVQKCVEPLLFFFFVRKRRIAEKKWKQNGTAASRESIYSAPILHHGEVHSYGSKFNS